MQRVPIRLGALHATVKDSSAVLISVSDAHCTGPNISNASLVRVCRVCTTREARYTCPRCNAPYCSVECYRSHGQECTEQFFESHVRSEMQLNSSARGDDQKQQKSIQELLERVKQFQEQAAVEEEEDAEALVERLQELAVLDATGELTLESLTDEERSKFLGEVADGRLGKLVELWSPWWLLSERKYRRETSARRRQLVMEEISSSYDKESNDIEPASVNIELTVLYPVGLFTDRDAEKMPASIKYLLPGGKEPSPCLRFHLVEMLFAYAVVLRVFNGDYTQDVAEAAGLLLDICRILSEDARYESVEHVCSSCLEKYTAGDPAANALGLSDVKQLLQSQIFLLDALSDTRELLQQYEQELGDSKDPDKKAKKERKAAMKRLVAVQKKLSFYQMWAYLKPESEFQDLAAEVEVYSKERIADTPFEHCAHIINPNYYRSYNRSQNQYVSEQLKMVTPSAAQSLQEKQRENLLRMLDFNSESADVAQDSIERWGDQWKVLIYDRFCRDIISPILKLHELRKKGVTLHMLLDTERDAIPDVPAIYFVEPTRENLERIVQDCAKELYSSVHLNFAYPLSRESLEYLARASVEAGCTSMIAKVFDQYTNFVSLEPSLFSLNLPGSYKAYNDPNVADVQIEQSMSAIVRGLFSVLATAGSVPVIRCPNNDGPSRMVAEQLSSAIREQLNARNSVFTESSSNFQRPVLIIMDRNEDIASSLYHPSTYQALVDDILSIQMNRVKVAVKSSSDEDVGGDGRTMERTHDLDVTTDKFFERHAGSMFPDAIDANEEEMKQVTRKEEQIRAQTGGGDTLLNGTKDLVAAVDTLPALVEKKKMLEVHTNIFHAAFEGVTKRQIPSYSMLEQKLIDGSHVDKAEVLQLLANKEIGTLADKMRLLMIYYLSSGATGAEMTEFENAYQQCAGSTDQPDPYMQAWKFLRKHSAFQRRASVGTAMQSENSMGPDGGVNMSKFKGLAQGFLAQAAASFKNFLPENKKLHVTRVTDAICEMKPSTEDETFLYLDPKIKVNGAVPRQRSPFREVMVFMIGGGNYNEYQNLLAYAKGQQTPRSIWYGCTELLNPEAFLHQLNSIGV